MENDDVIIYFSWSLPWENVQWGAPTGSLLREEAHKKKRQTQKSSKKSFCKIFISKRRKRWELLIVRKFQLFFFTSSYLWPAGNNIVGHQLDIYNTIAKIRLSSPNIDEIQAHLCFCLSWKIKTQYLVL